MVFIFYMQFQNLNYVFLLFCIDFVYEQNFFFYELQMINYSLCGWMVMCLTEKSLATTYQEDILLFYFLETLIILPLTLRPLVY